VADLSAFAAHLSESRRAEIIPVHRHRRRALGATVDLERPHAEPFLERGREPLRQFFCADCDEPQAAELLRRAAAQVKLKERRFILAHKLANGFGIERVRVKNGTDTNYPCQRQRAGESKRMEERQHPRRPALAGECKDLFSLSGVVQWLRESFLGHSTPDGEQCPGPVLLIPNHLSWLDGLFLWVCLDDHWRFVTSSAAAQRPKR